MHIAEEIVMSYSNKDTWDDQIVAEKYHKVFEADYP
jgi:hypothetical protein